MLLIMPMRGSCFQVLLLVTQVWLYSTHSDLRYLQPTYLSYATSFLELPRSVVSQVKAYLVYRETVAYEYLCVWMIIAGALSVPRIRRDQSNHQNLITRLSNGHTAASKLATYRPSDQGTCMRR